MSAFFDVNIAFNELIAALSKALDACGTTTLLHGQRVGVVAEKIASYLVPEKRKEILYAGLLHDIGALDLQEHITTYDVFHKQALPENIIQHPLTSQRIFKKIPVLKNLHREVRSHHEMYDGTGYPDGLKGEEIPFLSQILLLSDYFEVNTSKKPEITFEEITSLYKEKKGVYFSPELVEQFLEILFIEKEFFLNCRSASFIEEKLQDLLLSLNVQRVDYDLDECLEVFAEIIDSKHQYTQGHSERVAYYANCIAKKMNLPQEFEKFIDIAGALHDLGKLSVPVSILDKPGRLTDEETKIIREHPKTSQDILECFESLFFIAETVGCHHEWMDGSGYPNGYVGEDIPLISRILAVADTFDALSSDRAYRKALPPEKCISILENAAGKQLDKQIVTLAIEVLPIARDYFFPSHNTTYASSS